MLQGFPHSLHECSSVVISHTCSKGHFKGQLSLKAFTFWWCSLDLPFGVNCHRTPWISRLYSSDLSPIHNLLCILGCVWAESLSWSLDLWGFFHEWIYTGVTEYYFILNRLKERGSPEGPLSVNSQIVPNNLSFLVFILSVVSSHNVSGVICVTLKVLKKWWYVLMGWGHKRHCSLCISSSLNPVLWDDPASTP